MCPVLKILLLPTKTWDRGGSWSKYPLFLKTFHSTFSGFLILDCIKMEVLSRHMAWSLKFLQSTTVFWSKCWRTAKTCSDIVHSCLYSCVPCLYSTLTEEWGEQRNKIVCLYTYVSHSHSILVSHFLWWKDCHFSRLQLIWKDLDVSGKRECKPVSLLGLDVCMKANVPEKKTAKLLIVLIALF